MTERVRPIVRFLAEEGAVRAVIATEGRTVAAFDVDSGRQLWSALLGDVLGTDDLAELRDHPVDPPSFSIRGLWVDAVAGEVVLLVAAPAGSWEIGSGDGSAVVVLNLDGGPKRQLRYGPDVAAAAPRLAHQDGERFLALGNGNVLTLYPIDGPDLIAQHHELWHLSNRRTPGGHIWSDAPQRHEMGGITALDVEWADELHVICGWEGGEVQRSRCSGAEYVAITRSAHGLCPADEHDLRTSSTPYLHNINRRTVVDAALLERDGDRFGVSVGIDGRVVLEDGTVLFDSDPLRMIPSTDADYSTFSRQVTAFARCGSLITFAVDERLRRSTDDPSTRHDGARPVHVVDVRTGNEVEHFAGGDGPVRALDFVGGPGTMKVALTTDGTVALWDGSRGSFLWSVPFGTS